MFARGLLPLLATLLLAACASPTFVASVSVRHQIPPGVLKASAPAASGAAAVQAAMATPKAFVIERSALPTV
jgi:uncharacterized lipoprotein YajG